MTLSTHVETVNDPSHLYIGVSFTVRVTDRVRLGVKVRVRVRVTCPWVLYHYGGIVQRPSGQIP